VKYLKKFEVIYHFGMIAKFKEGDYVKLKKEYYEKFKKESHLYNKYKNNIFYVKWIDAEQDNMLYVLFPYNSNNIAEGTGWIKEKYLEKASDEEISTIKYNL